MSYKIFILEPKSDCSYPKKLVLAEDEENARQHAIEQLAEIRTETPSEVDMNHFYTQKDKVSCRPLKADEYTLKDDTINDGNLWCIDYKGEEYCIEKNSYEDIR